MVWLILSLILATPLNGSSRHESEEEIEDEEWHVRTHADEQPLVDMLNALRDMHTRNDFESTLAKAFTEKTHPLLFKVEHASNLAEFLRRHHARVTALPPRALRLLRATLPIFKAGSKAQEKACKSYSSYCNLYTRGLYRQWVRTNLCPKHKLKSLKRRVRKFINYQISWPPEQEEAQDEIPSVRDDAADDHSAANDSSVDTGSGSSANSSSGGSSSGAGFGDAYPEYDHTIHLANLDLAIDSSEDLETADVSQVFPPDDNAHTEEQDGSEEAEDQGSDDIMEDNLEGRLGDRGGSTGLGEESNDSSIENNSFLYEETSSLQTPKRGVSRKDDSSSASDLTDPGDLDQSSGSNRPPRSNGSSPPSGPSESHQFNGVGQFNGPRKSRESKKSVISRGASKSNGSRKPKESRGPGITSEPEDTVRSGRAHKLGEASKFDKARHSKGFSNSGGVGKLRASSGHDGSRKSRNPNNFSSSSETDESSEVVELSEFDESSKSSSSSRSTGSSRSNSSSLSTVSSSSSESSRSRSSIGSSSYSGSSSPGRSSESDMSSRSNESSGSSASTESDGSSRSSTTDESSEASQLSESSKSDTSNSSYSSHKSSEVTESHSTPSTGSIGRHRRGYSPRAQESYIGNDPGRPRLMPEDVPEPELITLAQLRALRDDTVWGLSSSYVQRLRIKDQLEPSDIARLSDNAFAEYTKQDLMAIRNFCQAIPPRQWAHLGERVPDSYEHPSTLITKDVLSRMTDGILIVLSAGFIGRIAPKVIGDLPSERIPLLDPTQLTEVYADQVSQFPPKSMATFRVEQMTFMGSSYRLETNKHPWRGLTLAQFRAMSLEVRRHLYRVWYEDTWKFGQAMGSWGGFGYILVIFLL